MNKTHIFTALVALTFVLIVSVVVRYTQAADVTATAEIQNEAPAVDTINFATTAYGTDNLTTSGILPNIGTTRTIHINGQITDLNGENDIVTSTVTVVFHRTSKTNTCTTDNNDCYAITSCATNTASGNDTQITYNCEVPIQYYIDATDSSSTFLDDSWTAFVRVEDAASSPATREATIEVNSLLALNLPDTIDYSTRSLGEVSSSTTNVETILTQRGNTKADVQVNGAIMNCTVLGTIPVNAQSWALTDVGHTSGTTLTGTATSIARNIGLRTSETLELSKSLYWNIAIPTTGVKGICAGANTILIISLPPEEAYLVDGRLNGIRYVTENRLGYSGGVGNIIIEEGETTSFYIGAVFLGSIAYEDIPPDRLIFLQDILGLDRSNVTDTKLIKIAKFVQSLATETDLTGDAVLDIPPSAHTNLTTNINFDSVDDATLQTEVQNVHPGRTLRTTEEAQEHMNETFVAEGLASNYLVSTSQGANTTISPSSRTVAYGNTTMFTVTSTSGYTTLASGCGGTLSGNTYTTGIITADCTVTTSAVADTFTVSTAASNVTFSPTSRTVNNGDPTAFNITANTGYDLAGASGCSGSLSGNTYTTGAITANCTVTATAALQTFAVTYNSNGSTSGTTPSNQTKTYGQNLALQTNSGTLAKTGYTFVGWNTNSSGTGTDYASEAGTYTANAAVTLYAKWIINTFTVSTSGSNLTFSPTSASVNYGETTSFTITANSGYDLTGASGCSGTLSGNIYTTGAITGACTVTGTASSSFTCGASTVAYAGGAYDAAGTNNNQGGYYRTVSIGTQCWMKDNLNVGTMLASGSTNPSNNGTTEKWCHSNDINNCNTDGGLYNWTEAMGYVTTEGVQGICPSGWHVPTDVQYKTLEVFLGMTQEQADATGWRGTDQGSKLSQYTLNGTNSSDFSAHLSGYRTTGGAFSQLSSHALLWSSSVSASDAWRRDLDAARTTVLRGANSQANGYSVRCLRD